MESNYKQGEMNLVSLERLPKAAQCVESGVRCVLTCDWRGMPYSVEAQAVSLYRFDARVYVVVEQDAKMIHPEHEQISISPGIYRAARDSRYSVVAHGKRVGKLALAIGQRVGLDAEHLQDLEFAAWIHDVGLIGCEEMLWKPAKFTEADWVVFKRHSAKSAAVVSKLSESCPHVADLERVYGYVLHHHEHFDGTGYPSGMSGREIPTGARIILVADAYDAMTSPRTYRAAADHEEAMEELRRCSGSQFDPLYVELLSVALAEEATSKGQAKLPEPVIG